MAGKKGSDKIAEGFGGIGDEVKSGGFVFPGADPHVGLGLIARVDSYTQHKSAHPGKDPYTMARFSDAVIFEPGEMREDGHSRLVKVGNLAMIVSAWIVSTLTPNRFPAGSVVKIVYDGVNKDKRNAKMFRVFTAPESALEAVTAKAEEDRDGTYAAQSGEGGDDDLPF